MTQDTSTEYVELNTFLKIKAVAPTGGRAKLAIREGSVKVNGVVETRNRRKLHAGDIIECFGAKYSVNEVLLK